MVHSALSTEITCPTDIMRCRYISERRLKREAFLDNENLYTKIGSKPCTPQTQDSFARGDSTPVQQAHAVKTLEPSKDAPTCSSNRNVSYRCGQHRIVRVRTEQSLILAEAAATLTTTNFTTRELALEFQLHKIHQCMGWFHRTPMTCNVHHR